MQSNFGPDEEIERIRSARRGLLVYFALLVPLSTLGYVLALHFPLGALFLMWAPGLSSIGARLLLREGIADISLRFGGRRTVRALPFILLYPVVIGLLAYGIAWGTGLASYTDPDTFIHAPPGLLFAAVLLFQVVAGTVVGLIGSVGEELGWRGYMLTRLVDARIPRPLLTSGIIWGIWHLPVILFGHYDSGPYPVLSVLLFMISVTSFGCVIGRLRLTTGSIWPAFLLHACWNAVIQDAFDSSTTGAHALLWTGESGVLVALALLATALLMSRRPLIARRLSDVETREHSGADLHG
ncbi:type II CAAX endopeptidase family protein [Cohnella sp. 56]|uniref:type II CAAX endopeptidase family protein n=1 Tax=Cohnella sp. 56 TaxID=3113722 RepID=UPI0030EA09DB